MSTGLGSTFRPNTPATEIAKSVGRDARTYFESIRDGGSLQVYFQKPTPVAGQSVTFDVPTPVMELWFRDGLFHLAGPTGKHTLAADYTDADRLAAHTEGFVEFALAAAGRPDRVHLSIWF